MGMQKINKRIWDKRVKGYGVWHQGIWDAKDVSNL